MEEFEMMLSGGHPNSLGRTIEVTEMVLADKKRFDDLYQCYFSKDEVVRLRVSNAMKRVAEAEPDWVYAYMDKLQDDISKIDQASTRWTLSQLFMMYESRLTDEQRKKALKIMKKNITSSDDWIVLNMTLKTLGEWAKKDAALLKWLEPVMLDLSKSRHNSVKIKAEKYLAHFSK